MLLVFFTGLLPQIDPNLADFGIHQHRIGILSLVAFSWWGALQGFGPGLAITIMGVDNSNTDYMGNLPGDFSPQFLYFLLAWLPFCLVALYLIRRFKRAANS